MKYNKTFIEEGESFDNYVKYLKTVKDEIPEQLFNFVSDSERHNLEEKSLHDSWIDEIRINESRERDINHNWQAKVQITITLLGPYHDRNFELKFSDVRSYKLDMKSESHTDLITYEVYPENLGETKLLVFNAEFRDDSVFLIKAKNIEINEFLFEIKS